MVVAAQRPLIIAGLDVLKDGSATRLSAFATQRGIPMITTYKAKGILAETHELALGGAGLSPLSDKHLLPFVKASDLILCVGYDPIEMRPGWREIWDPEATNVIDITAVSNDHYMHQATLNFVADTGATLDALDDAAKPDVWAGGEISAVKAALTEAFPKDDQWGPAAVMDTCRDVLPDDTIATVDSGAHRILLSQMWTCYQPKTLLQSTALCTMGCAVPLAMGAKICGPEPDGDQFLR